MSRATVWIAFGLLLLSSLAGCCSIDLGFLGASGYTFDTGKIGSGQQAINPSNDSPYWNGQPMDDRARR